MLITYPSVAKKTALLNTFTVASLLTEQNKLKIQSSKEIWHNLNNTKTDYANKIQYSGTLLKDMLIFRLRNIFLAKLLHLSNERKTEHNRI